MLNLPFNVTNKLGSFRQLEDFARAIRYIVRKKSSP